MLKFIRGITKGPEIILADEFYKNIERKNTKTFENLYLKNVKSKEKEKHSALKADRNILVRIIAAYEFDQKVDLAQILCNEMMHVPISLAEHNGYLKSGDKALLQKRLLENIDCPQYINLNRNSACLIIDGQALVSSIGKRNDCKTFGDLADVFIKSVLQQGMLYDRIDVVFDRYRLKSIKENTRKRRTKDQKRIRKKIEHRAVPLPTIWSNLMACPENKAEYANFLSTQLKLKAPYEKEIVTSGGFMDELEVWSSKDTTNTSQLSSTHEEADTRMIIHAINSNYKYIVVISRDTDVLDILASLFHRTGSTELWMMAGTQSKPKYIPVHTVVNSIPQNSLNALIAFHTLTGCDTTSFIA